MTFDLKVINKITAEEVDLNSFNLKLSLLDSDPEVVRSYSTIANGDEAFDLTDL